MPVESDEEGEAVWCWRLTAFVLLYDDVMQHNDDANDDRDMVSCFLLLLLMSLDIINRTDPLPNQPSMESTACHVKLTKGSKAGWDYGPVQGDAPSRVLCCCCWCRSLSCWTFISFPFPFRFSAFLCSLFLSWVDLHDLAIPMGIESSNYVMRLTMHPTI